MNKQFPYILSIILLIGLTECKNNAPSKPKDEFSFIFMTDIHLEPERKAPLGFKQAIDSVNAQNPDFVITGGDLIMDALGQTYGRADTLYNLYNQMSGNFNCPVYNSMGNHEIYGIYDKSHAD